MDVDAVTADFKQLFEEITGLVDTNFEASYNRYDSQSRKIVEKHTPMITRTIRENQDPPWMDTEFKLNRAKRRKLLANELLDKRKVRVLPEHDDPVKLANDFNRYYV